MALDLRPLAERPGRAASAALPPVAQVPLCCDMCGCARPRDERDRLVWESSPATRLVLADLCGDCARSADSLLELYGGRGRNGISLVHEIHGSPPPRSVQPRVLGSFARGVLYLLIAVASFVLVTLVTSGGP
jgi:hypothetical protein